MNCTRFNKTNCIPLKQGSQNSLFLIDFDKIGIIVKRIFFFSKYSFSHNFNLRESHFSFNYKDDNFEILDSTIFTADFCAIQKFSVSAVICAFRQVYCESPIFDRRYFDI